MLRPAPGLEAQIFDSQPSLNHFRDTLAELFCGNQSLFAGLYCQQRWDWSQRYSVIRISFGGGVLKTRAELERRMLALLRTHQQALGLSCSDPHDAAGCFAELIRSAHAQSGQRAVVLVDQYDQPMLDNITEAALARQMQMRDGLRDL